MTDKPELTRAMTPSQSGELAEKVREACAAEADRGPLHLSAGYKIAERIRALDLSPFAVQVGTVAHGRGRLSAARDALAAPSPVGLVEETCWLCGLDIIGCVDAEKELRHALNAAQGRALDAEQRVGELLESERALQTEVEELVDRQEQWRERAEQLQRENQELRDRIAAINE